VKIEYQVFARVNDSEWVRWLGAPHPNRESAQASVDRLLEYRAPGWEFEIREVEV
jgi:hypothetical protein